MLNDADASGFKKVYLAMGFTDLRRGIDGLATIVRFQFKLDPYDKNTLFLNKFYLITYLIFFLFSSFIISFTKTLDRKDLLLKLPKTILNN